MSAVNNTVETVNAAATAIVSAETRVQPTAAQKKRWRSFWSLYWCFGSPKPSKRIGHAVLVPEPVVMGASVPVTDNTSHSSAMLLPFIAPPSSPASFLQSDPPSATQSPAGFLSLTSLSVNAYSSPGPPSVFAVGPYAHETQLVSPPAFSTFTTEPSTASYTPPPEPVQLTTPSSPEVPFAQLLTSSLARRRSCGINHKFALSQYDYQPYQLYHQGSPVSHLISPGSVVSNSGTSSPFPGKPSIIEFRIGEVPKILGFEHFSTRRWGSRLGSGSLTPDGAETVSRDSSLLENQTSEVASLANSDNGSQEVPKVLGFEHFSTRRWGSRLGSGSLTPDGAEPVSRDSFLLENQISEVASLANSENGSHHDNVTIDHRVSFELTAEDAAACLEKDADLSIENVPERLPPHLASKSGDQEEALPKKTEECCKCCVGQALDATPGKSLGEGHEEQCPRKHRSISFGSIKEFNFDNTKEEISDKTNVSSEWWANEKVIGEELEPHNNWTFFPVLQWGVS